jgi:hypothetical protein
MPDYKVNPQPWMKDARRVADDALVKALVEDFRSYNPSPRSPLNQPPQTVVPVGAGKVVTAGEQVRRGTGWTDPPSIDKWKPPGVEHMDRMMDQQDAIDRAERVRQLAGASAAQRALAQAAAEAEARDKAQEEQPKPTKEKGSK